MKQFLASVLLLVTAGATAQVWCPPGAVWHYQWWDFSSNGYVRMEHAGDTLVNGMLGQKLRMHRAVFNEFSGTREEGPWRTYVTRTSQDLVSIWNGASFDTLYAFGAVPGTAWNVPLMHAPERVRLTVTDTGTIVHQGLPLRFLAVSYDLAFGTWGDTIVERLGAKWVFIDASFTLRLDGPLTGLRCYRDTAVQYVSGLAPSCEHIMGGVGMREAGGDARITLFPNPGNERFTVEWDVARHGPAQLELRDAQGRLVRTVQVASSSFTVETTDLPIGLYLLRLAHGQGVHTAKWTKE